MTFYFNVIPWNTGMMEDWNNDKRPKTDILQTGNYATQNWRITGR